VQHILRGHVHYSRVPRRQGRRFFLGDALRLAPDYESELCLSRYPL
jgi:hypothetical protein